MITFRLSWPKAANTFSLYQLHTTKTGLLTFVPSISPVASKIAKLEKHPK